MPPRSSSPVTGCCASAGRWAGSAGGWTSSGGCSTTRAATPGTDRPAVPAPPPRPHPAPAVRPRAVVTAPGGIDVIDLPERAEPDTRGSGDGGVQRRPRPATDDVQAAGDALTHLVHMADDADHPAARAQFVQHPHDGVEGVGIETAEALVDEEGVEDDPAGFGGDGVGQPEREGERGHEGLTAGERLGGADRAGVVVTDVEAEATATSAAARLVGVHEFVTATGHPAQPDGAGPRDLLEPRGEHVGAQGHAAVVLPAPGDHVGEAVEFVEGALARGQTLDLAPQL